MDTEPVKAEKGDDILLRMKSATGSMETVAGIRLSRDVNEKFLRISGKGIFGSQEADAIVRRAFFGGTINTWQISKHKDWIAEGPFFISALEYAGHHAGEIMFDVELTSSGPVTISPEAE